MSVFMVLPLLYTVVTAFKPVNELFLYPPKFFVQNPTLENFTTMVRLVNEMWVPFERYLFNSLFVAAVGTVGYVAIAGMAAYALAKYRHKWLKVFYVVVVWAILFRPEVTGIPQYIIISRLGLINTYWAILLPMMSGSFGVFLVRQFVVTAVPDSVIEAAHIDGASEARLFASIVVPMVKPALLTLSIFTFQGLWNASGVTYIYDESMKVLPVMLRQIASAGIARAGAGAAVALVLMVPPVVFFLISQSAVMETMSHSGMK
jgi:ABC-type glycerol-3-phosphate transport system permease component